MILTKQDIDVIGYCAATMATISFLPQLIRVVKLRTARDISLGMFLIFSIGIALWLIYGLLQHDIPLIAANGITLVLALTILGFKIRHG